MVTQYVAVFTAQENLVNGAFFEEAVNIDAVIFFGNMALKAFRKHCAVIFSRNFHLLLLGFNQFA